MLSSWKTSCRESVKAGIEVVTSIEEVTYHRIKSLAEGARAGLKFNIVCLIVNTRM
jgi:hypothetical protein